MHTGLFSSRFNLHVYFVLVVGAYFSHVKYAK